MTIDETVLSLSFDSKKSKRREAALRSSGFEVISAHSPTQARYEIETGRCGIFVTCRTVPDIVNRHLMELFKQYCPTGWIIFVTGSEASRTGAYEPEADVRVPESEDPDGVVQALSAKREQARTQQPGGCR